MAAKFTAKLRLKLTGELH